MALLPAVYKLGSGGSQGVFQRGMPSIPEPRMWADDVIPVESSLVHVPGVPGGQLTKPIAPPMRYAEPTFDFRGAQDELDDLRKSGQIGKVKGYSAADYQLQKQRLKGGALGKIGRIAGSLPFQLGMGLALPMAFGAASKALAGPNVTELAEGLGSDYVMSEFLNQQALATLINTGIKGSY
jgi:hypothetical protein